MELEDGSSPFNDKEISFQSPVCLEISHFESNVDKFGNRQKKYAAMTKRLVNRHPGIVKQLSLNVKI